MTCAEKFLLKSTIWRDWLFLVHLIHCKIPPPPSLHHMENTSLALIDRIYSIMENLGDLKHTEGLTALMAMINGIQSELYGIQQRNANTETKPITHTPRPRTDATSVRSDDNTKACDTAASRFPEEDLPTQFAQREDMLIDFVKDTTDRGALALHAPQAHKTMQPEEREDTGDEHTTHRGAIMKPKPKPKRDSRMTSVKGSKHSR